MSPDDIQIRRDICRACKRECDVRATINHADPCAGCPQHVWHVHRGECGSTQPQAPSPELVPPPQRPNAIPAAFVRGYSFRHRVWVYRQRGLLAPASERHRRRDICAACPDARPTGHKGLYRCGAKSCGCGGGDELRMAMPKTACQKWLPGERPPTIV